VTTRSVFAAPVLLLACSAASPPSNCVDCSVTVEPIAWIGAEDDRGMLVSYITSVNLLRSGRISVYDWNDRGRVRIHHQDGSWAGGFGRFGHGPGEFQAAFHTSEREDGSLVVFDPRAQRMTVLRGDDYRPVETHPIAGLSSMNGILPLADGRYLVNGLRGGNESIGLPLHLLDATGKWIRSFGGEVFGSWDSNLQIRLMAEGPDGRIWVAHQLDYRIESWDTAGSLLSVIDDRPSWFTAEGPARPVAPDSSTPRSRIIGLWVSEGDHLGVAVNNARDDWASRLVPLDPPVGTRRYTHNVWPDDFYTTRLMMLDSTTGAVLAMADAPVGLTRVMHTGFAYEARLEQQEPRIRTWRISLNLEGG
jgi:hypothetical protein